MVVLPTKKKRFWVSISLFAVLAAIFLVILFYPHPTTEQQNANAVRSASVTLKPLLDELNSSVSGADWRVTEVGGFGASLGNLEGGSGTGLCEAVVYKSKSDWLTVADPKLWSGPVPKVYQDPKTGFWMIWFMSPGQALKTPCRESFVKVLNVKDQNF